jgi:DNA-binding MarR family transcriptional regulator
LSGNVSVTYGRSILLALAEVDGRSQRELSVRLGLHRNVMVAMVDALEA